MDEQIKYLEEYKKLEELRKKINKLIEFYRMYDSSIYIGEEKIEEIEYIRLLRIIQIVEKYLPRRKVENIDLEEIKKASVIEKVLEQLKSAKIFNSQKKQYKIKLDIMLKKVPHFVISEKEKKLIFSISLIDLKSLFEHKYIPAYGNGRNGRTISFKKEQIAVLRKVVDLAREYELETNKDLVRSSNEIISDYYSTLVKLRQLDRTLCELEGHKNRDYILDEQLNGEILNPNDEPKGPGILEDYRQASWGIERICLDGIQNHLPADSLGTRCWLQFEIDGKWYDVEIAKKAYSEGKNISRVRFADDGVGFTPQNLLFLHSTKSSERDSAGQFGEGMKLASLAAMNLGLGMEFQSRNWSAEVIGIDTKITNTRDDNKEEVLKKLAYKIREYSGTPLTGSRTIFNTPSKEFIEYALNLPERVLSLKTGYKPVYSDNKGEIVSINEPGKIYVKGIYIQNLNTLFSYNFIDAEVNPDRNKIIGFDITKHIYDMLYNLTDKKAMKKILEALYIANNINVENYYDDYMQTTNYIEFGFGRELLIAIKDGRGVPSLWKEAFEELFSNVIMLSSSEEKAKGVIKLRNYTVPDVLKCELSRYNVIHLNSDWEEAIVLSGALTNKSVLPNIVSEKIITGVSLKYCSIWDEERIMIDAVQNHLPSDSRGTVLMLRFQTKDGLWHKYEEIENYSNDEIIKIKIADNGIGYAKESLGLFASTKNESSSGKWGEGLKILCASLLGQGMKVTLKSRLWKATARAERMSEDDDNDKKGLVFDVLTSINDTDSISDGDDYSDVQNFREMSSTIIETPSEKLLEEFRHLDNKVLLLRKSNAIAKVGSVSLLDFFGGDIFVKNLHVHKGKMVKYSYHFEDYDIQDRDRKNISSDIVRKYISNFLSNVDNEQFIVKLLNDAYNSNPNELEFRTDFEINSRNVDLWLKVIKSKYGDNFAIKSIQSQSIGEEGMAHHVGLTIITFPATIANALVTAFKQKGIVCDYDSKIKSLFDGIKKTPEEEYTEYEKFIIKYLLKFNQILNIQKKDSVKKGLTREVTNIGIYEAKGESIMVGGFSNQSSTVYLNRILFLDLSKLCDTFFHESGHALSGGNDADAIFRDFFTYLLASLAIETIDIKKELLDAIKLNDDEQLKKLFNELYSEENGKRR